jgi:Rrf2 family transcriptional regulator, nitric oxide-sensitive transcriptional repressor
MYLYASKPRSVFRGGVPIDATMQSGRGRICRSNSSNKDLRMRLTTFSDYALRLLMYAAVAGDRLITIEEASQVYKISRGHLMKIANMLTRAGYLHGVRGRSGGLMLAKRPEDIRLGDVVRISEPDFALVECFGADNRCVITKCCRLPDVLNEALSAFMKSLDRYTLADLILRPKDFSIPPAKRGNRGPTIRGHV